MLRIYASLTTLVRVGRERALARRHDEAGLTTLEWVILALGLFMLAGTAVVMVREAVVSRLGRI